MTSHTFQRTGDCTLTVSLGGDLTASGVPGLQTELKQHLVDTISELIFDLSGAAMLDSSGIGLLIASANSMTRRNGRIRAVNASADILQLFQSMRLVGRLNVAGRQA